MSAGTTGPTSDTHSGANGAGGPGQGPGGREGAVGIATALAEISERATLLIHEEVELAKAEVTESVTKLARGAAVSVIAGVFIVTAILFGLIGCAWLIYFYLPVNAFAFFWGFFAMAVILLLLGALAGAIAARVFRSSPPPVPNMAIEEARKIRETVSAPYESEYGPPGSSGFTAPTPVPPVGGAHAPMGSAAPPVPPVAPTRPPEPPAPAAPAPEPPAPAAGPPAHQPSSVSDPVVFPEPPEEVPPVFESEPSPEPAAEPPAEPGAQAHGEPRGPDPSDATTDDLGPPVQEPLPPEDPKGDA